MRLKIYSGLALAVIATVDLFVHDAMAVPRQTDEQRHVKEFLRLARSELATSKTCVEASEYLRRLSFKQRLSVARATVNDRDANIGYLVANILIAHGYARDAVPALAGILVSGRAQTQLNGRFGYDWVHSDDDTLVLRLLIMIHRYLLANLSKYAGEERRRVEDLLMGGLFLEKPSEAFSIPKAKNLISEWESELQGRR